jgi:hypothetical protein
MRQTLKLFVAAFVPLLTHHGNAIIEGKSKS